MIPHKVLRALWDMDGESGLLKEHIDDLHRQLEEAQVELQLSENKNEELQNQINNLHNTIHEINQNEGVT